MRVALVCPYDLSVPGGVQNQVLGWAKELTRRGHDARVLAPGTGAPAGVPVAWNGSVARIAWGPDAAYAVRSWLRSVDADVVHVHEPTAPSLGWWALRHATRRWPTVATFHQAGTPPWALRWARRGLGRSLGELGAAICVSRTALDAAAPLRLPAPVVIGNGVDVAAWSQAAEWPRRSAVAFLGRRGDPRKGYRLFEDAARALSADYPDVEWWALGPGDPVRAPVVEPEGPGAVDPASLRRRLGEASIVVVPNLGGESFGLVLVEALAAGARVVASDLPAFTDVLQGAGATFPTGDGDALRLTLAAMLEGRDELHERENRMAVARAYSWDAVGDRILEQYRRAERRAGGTR